MAPSSKRSQRVRRELRSDATERPDDSSPSRPPKRRKKTGSTPQEQTDEDSSSILADQSAVNLEDDDQIVARVTQHLLAPADQPVQASRDHSNSIHESNKEGVKAYAKIAAQDWTYYVTSLRVNIGRSSEPARADHGPENEEDFVHIDLGPSKLISRQHALIYFHPKEESWFLLVKGRNSLKVDGVPWKPGQAGALKSGEVIEIGGVEMMFVLPVDVSPLHVQDQYMQRAGITKPEAAAGSRHTRHPLPSGDISAGRSARLPGSQKPLAPAPPDYKRPGTPPSARSRILSDQLRTPHLEPDRNGPASERLGPTPMNPGDLDLSLDRNREYKPQYSYSQMITQAIISTDDEKLNLNGIYNFITDTYAYYRHQPASGWQNSIRHNLSLNKAFEKVPRSQDEPGKGMKWQLVPDVRDEMIKNAYKGGRGGHRGSSNPSSPNHLNFAHSPNPGSARKRKVSPSGSPQPRSTLRNSHLTPVRDTRRPLPDEATIGVDGSPLPRPRQANPSSLGLTTNPPASPLLTSSYLQEDGSSFVTPAPLRVHPKLNPPSTAQRPSQHMPTSSPAPFWKYAEIGSTPLRPAQFDLSPSKGGLGNLPASSSPPRLPASLRLRAPRERRGRRPRRPPQTLIMRTMALTLPKASKASARTTRRSESARK